MENETTTLYLALVHHPVLNKNRETIGSAITNLDIHDIARMARTYGVAEYFVISPYQDQHEMAQELLDHWCKGYGSKYNPARKEALDRVRLAWYIEDVTDYLQKTTGSMPLVVTTSALQQGKNIDFAQLRVKIIDKEPILVLFGTAHGLAKEIIENADYSLPPIVGGTSYNHLSVRTAAAITVDRLLGS